MALRPTLVRVAVSFGAAIAAAFVCAVLLAIVNIYLTGHNRPSIINTQLGSAPGIHLGVGDVILGVVVIAAAAVTWFATAPKRD
jgi:hypothetical protein